MSLATPFNLTPAAAQAIARGLYAVAKSDGLNEREAGLIQSFWLDTGGSASALAELSRSADITPEELATALPHAEEHMLFLKTALLLAWADGRYSDEEKKSITDFAHALKVDAAELHSMEGSVKEYLLGHLAHLKNTEATVIVAQKLGV